MIASRYQSAAFEFLRNSGFWERKNLVLARVPEIPSQKMGRCSKIIEVRHLLQKSFLISFSRRNFCENLSQIGSFLKFSIFQPENSRVLESRIWSTKNENYPIWLKFSEKLRLEKLIRKLFWSECLTSIFLELRPIFCTGISGTLAKIKFFLSLNPNFLKNSKAAP